MAMRVAIHQPNFVPWLPYFYKMAMVDKFIILNQVQFEKNGYQNRYRLSSGKWVTKPVRKGTELICDKYYTDGIPLAEHNIELIQWIKTTLGIATELYMDVVSNSFGSQRLLDNLNYYGATSYITNPAASDKYLDEALLMKAGIDVEYCTVPKHLNIHVWEAFELWGVDGTKKQLKGAVCKA